MMALLKDKKISGKKEGIKISIFIKLLLILLVVSIIPTVVSFFLTVSTYQKIIETGVIQKYLPRGDVGIEKELFLAQKNIRVQATLLLLWVIFLTAIICFWGSRSLTKPIRELLKGAREVSKGNLEIELRKKSEDEIGELVEGFNQMVKDLRKSHRELQEAKNILEIKVRARTKELEELTGTLEEKVESRTKRLEAKIEELEKFQKLTVGRELEIAELKKKIKKLEEESKKQTS